MHRVTCSTIRGSAKNMKTRFLGIDAARPSGTVEADGMLALISRQSRLAAPRNP